MIMDSVFSTFCNWIWNALNDFVLDLQKLRIASTCLLSESRRITGESKSKAWDFPTSFGSSFRLGGRKKETSFWMTLAAPIAPVRQRGVCAIEIGVGHTDNRGDRS